MMGYNGHRPSLHFVAFSTAVQLFLGQMEVYRTVKNPGIELEDALSIAERIDIQQDDSQEMPFVILKHSPLQHLSCCGAQPTMTDAALGSKVTSLL